MRGVVMAGMAATFSLILALPAEAAEGTAWPTRDWSFNGIFGSFDEAALQRGFQVYAEVCAGCHGIEYITFRNLRDIGLSEADAKAIAAEYEVEAGPDADGEMYLRTAILADVFPSPFANDNAARASNNGALPPDLSLITKARAGGADYLYALLTGYEDEAPEGVELGDGMSYNHYFRGNQIAMPPPISEDAVEYTDGTAATVEQMSADVSQFLTWTAEPELEVRKRLGIKTILFLLVLTGLLYATKRKVWSNVEH